MMPCYSSKCYDIPRSDHPKHGSGGEAFSPDDVLQRAAFQCSTHQGFQSRDHQCNRIGCATSQFLSQVSGSSKDLMCLKLRQ